MTKEIDQVDDDQILFREAKELIANKIYPQDVFRTAKNKANGMIVAAESHGAFERESINSEDYLPKTQFEHWAAQKWPIFAELFELPQYLLHAEFAPAEIGYKRKPLTNLPVIDTDSLSIPDDHGELKNLYKSTWKELQYMKWHLANCKTELDPFINRDNSLRKKLSEKGKEGGRHRAK